MSSLKYSKCPGKTNIQGHNLILIFKLSFLIMFHNVKTFPLFYENSTHSKNLWNKKAFLNLFFRPPLVLCQAISLDFQTPVLTFCCSYCSKTKTPYSERMSRDNLRRKHPRNTYALLNANETVSTSLTKHVCILNSL